MPITKEPKTLAERIRYLRGDMSQKEFGEIIGASQGMISNYEGHHEIPTAKKLLGIARFANCSIEWLLTGQDTLGKERVKKVSAKNVGSMNRKKLVELAADYIRETRLPEAEKFAEMMNSCFNDRKRLKKVIDYHESLESEERRKSRKRD